MPLLRDLFDKFFKTGEDRHENRRDDDHWRRRDEFRNPIWQNDEEDEDDYSNNTNSTRSPPNFDIFSDPLEITRYFEKEMEGLMQSILRFGNEFSEHDLALPSPASSEKHDLRDEVLKTEVAIPSVSGLLHRDEDIDGSFSLSDFHRSLGSRRRDDEMSTITRNHRSGFRSVGQSVITHTTRRPDGSIEERRTVKDTDGNSETVIKNQIGDKVHEVIITTDKNGVETRTENFENMDEEEIKKLQSNWESVDKPIAEPIISTRFQWQKFFDFDPKI